MNVIISLYQYFVENSAELLSATYIHILMVLVGMISAVIVGVPLGIICIKNSKLASTILNIANVIQVLPSLALLVVLMLVFGLGFKPVVIGLFLYSLLPIIRNTYVGLKEVDPSVLQAGRGLGMSNLQLLLKIQFPLSMPFILSGIRIAAVIAIGVAALAPFVGGGGLGKIIYSGINLGNPLKIYSAGILAALLALLVDYTLVKAQQKLEK